MDSENIASILKDAINASSSKIQTESKHTKVFVLPPEFLEGLQVKNETPKVDNTTKDETSNSKNSNKTAKNKTHSLHNLMSTTLPVDRPKRTSNRQHTTNKEYKTTRSRTASKNNLKGLTNKEHNLEISDASTSVEKITIQKKSNRGKKAKAGKERRSSDLYNVEKTSDTILEKDQEKIENNHKLEDCFTGEISNNLLENYCIEKSSTIISDKIEEKLTENMRDLQNSSNEIYYNEIQENNLPNMKTIDLSHQTNTCETLKVVDVKTQAIDQVLKNPHIEISQSDSSQTISNGEISTEVHLNDTKRENVLSSEHTQLSKDEEIIEEETYIVEEIIEILESDEDSISDSNDKINVLEEINIETQKDFSVENVDFRKKVSDTFEIKSESTSKHVPYDFKPIVEQKRPIAAKVYINKRKNRNQTNNRKVQEKSISQKNSLVGMTLNGISLEGSRSEPQNIIEIQEKFNLEINRNFDCNSLNDTDLTDVPVVNLCRELECSQKVGGKSIAEVEHLLDQNNLANIAKTEIVTVNQCQEIKYSQVPEESNLEKDCNYGKNNVIDTDLTENVNVYEKLRNSQKIQEKSNSDIECNSDQNSLIHSALKENECQETKYSQKIQNQTNVDVNCRVDQIIFDTTILPEMSNINSCEVLKQEEITAVLENDNNINDVEKTDNKNKTFYLVEEFIESLQDYTESTEEIQSIDCIEQTNNTHGKLKNQIEDIETKTHNTRTRRTSANSSQPVTIINEAMEISKGSTENSELSELAKHLLDSHVNNDVEENTDISNNEIQSNIPSKNDDLGESKAYWVNKNDCMIKSLHQFRNRTKVVPRNTKNFNKLKNNIEKESLHSKNGDKSDIPVGNNVEVSNNRTRSISLNLETSNPEKLANSAKKLSQKPKSIDNYLKNENRMSTLKRHNAIPKNEIKPPPVLDESKQIQSKEISSSKTVNCEKNAINKNHDHSIVLKDIVDCNSTTMKISDSTIIQKVDEIILTNSILKTEEIIVPESNLIESNLNDKLNRSTGDLRNEDILIETAVPKSKPSLKQEKVIVIKKIQQRRRSKFSQAKNDPPKTTDIHKNNSISNQMDDSKITDIAVEKNLRQVEIPEIDKNKVDEKFNYSAIDSSNCQMDISIQENASKIKIKKVSPDKKGRRGMRAKSISSNEITAENAEDVCDINKNSHQLENADDLMHRVEAGMTAKSENPDGNIILSKDNTDKISECCSGNASANVDCQVENGLEESSLKIKTEKVTLIKVQSKRGRRSKSISSNVVKAENTKNNIDINKNSHELKSKDDLNYREEAVINNVTTIYNKLPGDDITLPTNNLDKCSSVGASVADSQVETALADKCFKIKTPVKRGNKGKRPRSKPTTDNITIKKHNEYNSEDNTNYTSFEVPEDFPVIDSIVTNDIVASSGIEENERNARLSGELNEKSAWNFTNVLKFNFEVENASAESSLKKKTQDVCAPKKKNGKRGRPSKSFKINDSVEGKEIGIYDCMPLIEAHTDLEKDNVTVVEDVNKSNYVEKSVNVDLKIDSNNEENSATHDSNLDTININDEIKGELEKNLFESLRRNSKHDGQDTLASNISEMQVPCKKNIEKPMRRNKRSSIINAKFDITDDEQEEKNSGTMEVRKSRRRQKSMVNYRVPDEDVDVFDSEAQVRQKLSENAPKKRRGRPSRAEILKRNAVVEGNVEQNSQESTEKKDTSSDSIGNDSASPAIDTSNTSSRKRRTVKRSAINEDVFEVESKSTINQNSLDISVEPEAESVLDKANDTNNFEDNHLSDKQEDEDSVEECKPRRGRKRKSFCNIYKARKRGRPKKQEVDSNDEDYTPHHSYVPNPTKVKEKLTDTTDKKMVKCGKCEKEVVRHQWYSHNLYSHNDMSWIEGTEKPNFENDQKLLIRILTIAHKKKHKKGLVCETCREVKKSVVGFISHITFCGKSDEEIASLLVTCEACGGRFKPSSMEYHERQHRLEGDIKKKKELEMSENMVEVMEPRSKRKAAEKAVTKISEFTALVKDEDGLSAMKKMKLSSPHIKKFIQKPQATKKISSITIAKWTKELENKQDAACTQLGCNFTCKSMDEMRKHYSSCNFTATENYVCKVCRYQTLFEDEIIKHAAEKHTSEDLDRNAMSDAEASSDDDYSDFGEDSSNQGQGLVKKFFYKETSDVANKMFKFIFNNGACHTIHNKTFHSGIQWTLEFERKNFKFNMFNKFMPNAFTLLEKEEAKKYLPELDMSMPVRFTKQNSTSDESEWKNWSRFEASRVDDSPTFFVGGPVWAMAWAPTPSFFAISDDLPQFLAISTHPTMDSEYSAGKSYSGKNIIQIWSLGKLNNRNLSESDPELSYAITHNGGTVWSLEWCPSGCYQHEDFPILKGENDSNRLGLLAAGCSDGCIRIFSLSLPKDLHSPNENQHAIYKTEPVAKLIVSTEIHDSKSETWQVMKLCWSREANHNVIVAGLSNGYVAFWDLTTKSPMLKYQVDNTTFYRPYKQFFAHHHAVTMITLVPHGNKRYLATASLDKLYKFWDLEDTTRPKNTFKKSIVTDGSWFNNWCCGVVAHDEALCMGHNASVCLPLRDYTYKYYNLLPSNSTTYAISTSDFGNSLATGNVAGELLTLFPHQVIYIRDMEKTIPPKRGYSLVSTTEVVDFKVEPVNNSPLKKDKKAKKSDPYSNPTDFSPSTYNDSKDRFGIQFNDNMNLFESSSKKSQKYKKKQPLTCEHLEKTAIEQYPLKSINKVAWNPNASSFLWLATGYQNGFVRLISFKSVSTVESNKLLQSHTDALNAQMTGEQAEPTAEDNC